MGVVIKSHPCGFIIEQLFHIEQNVPISHFIVQNHFRWNYSKRRAGESTGKIGAEQINSNEHHRQEVIKGSWLIKTTSIASKVFFKNQNQKKRIIQVRPSIYQPTHYPPLITPTLRSASGQGGSPGSRTLRRSSTKRWNNFTWLTWGEKCDIIIL